MKNLAFGILALVALAACQPNELKSTERQANYNNGENVILSLVGEGACLRCFNIYRNMDHQKAFAISSSGRFGYSNSKSSTAAAQRDALSQCRARNGELEAKQPCRMLMTGDRYVWKG